MSSTDVPPNLEESKLGNPTAIKRVATLNDADFKLFHEQAADFVAVDTGPCASLPRSLTNEVWRGLVDELVDDLNLGGDYWNAERKGFNPDTDLVYPENTES